MTDNVFIWSLAYENNAYKYGSYGINFIVEIDLFALNVLREMNLIDYIFHLCSVVDKFMWQ